MRCITERSRFRSQKKRGVSSIIGMVFFVLIIFIAFTALTLIFNSFVAYNNTVISANRKILLDQQTSLSISGFTFGSPISSRGPTNIPTGILYYVPITVTNSQSSPVSGSTPVLLSLNWNDYASYLDNPVDNILFFDASGNSLNTWIENGTANTVTNSIVWVQLNATGIPANDAITIYLGFFALGSNQLNAAGPTGEAPQLTSTYAEYDDGSQVFSAYFNGNTPLSQFNLGANIALAQVTGVTYGTETINALQLTGTGNDITLVYNVALPNVPITAESSFETQAVPTSQGAVALNDNANPGSSQNAMGVDQGYGASYFSNAYELNGGYTFDQNQQGTATTAWEYASVSYLGSSASSWNGYIAPELYLPSSGYTGTVTNNPLGGSSGMYLSVLTSASANYPDNMYYNWMRGRISPPNGVMPTVTFGSLVSTASSVSSSTSTVGTSSSSTLPYLPITITNSQTLPTPNPFQEEVSWNPSIYAAYEAANLGNVRFCADSQCNTPLYAWLQSCNSVSCTSSATLASVWVRLTSSIAANGGSMMIYMVFMPTTTNFDGNYWGEAPTLSTNYGQYDNGANVFTLYDNFAGNTLSGIWSVSSNNRGTYSVNNGITFTTTANFGHVFIYSATVTEPQVAEAYMTSVSGDNPMLGVDTQSAFNRIGMYNGYSLNWYSSTDSLCPENSGGTGTCSTLGVTSFPSGVWSVYWGTAGVEGSTDGSGNTITSTDNSLGNIANYGIYLGTSRDSSGSNTIQWARMRAYPPNNVMPSTSLGPVMPASGTATEYSFERKVVYSQGLWWAFYSDGSNIGYSTSENGGTWSSETVITSANGASNGYDFNVWLTGNILYYVLAGNGQGNSLQWRYGNLQSSGSISWSIPESSVTTTNNVYSYNSIVTDSYGNVWVAVNTNDGTNTHIEVWEYSSGAWSKVKDISPLPPDATPILVPLSIGVALVYGEGSSTAAVEITTTTTGSSWTSAVSAPSDYMLFSSSATSIGNTIYFAGLASASAGATSGTVKFWTFTSGSSATSTETQIESSSSTWLATISEEPNRSLIIFYGSGSNLYYSYSVDAGATWYPAVTISSAETAISGLTSTFSGGGAMWTEGNAIPYTIKFATIPSLTATNNSPFPVHLISLYIYNIDANTLVHFDINPAGSGVSGSFDYWLGAGETMSIPLPSFGWTVEESYLVKVTTDQGVMSSFSFVSPS